LAGIDLTKYFEKHSLTLVVNKYVIDMGSGTGVTSIAAALFGAKHVTCTNGEPNVAELVRANIQHVNSKQLQ
jgi:predicted nicotinamide N-methyase